MLASAIYLGLFAAASAVARPDPSPVFSRRVVHERRQSPPNGWNVHRRAHPDTILPLTIALAQSNVDKLDTYLLNVSDPASPHYGKHWTRQDVANTFRPTQHTVDIVHSWLASEGVDPSRIKVTKSGGFVRLNVTVSEAEAILGTEYHVFEHEDGSTHIACLEAYSLPELVSKHVDLVWPTLHSGVSRRKAPARRGVAASKRGHPIWKVDAVNTSDPLSSCEQLTTLACIRALYKFDYDLVVPEKHSLGIVEFGVNRLYDRDLDVFFEQYAPLLMGKRPTLVSINGGTLSQDPARDNLFEANMDFQYAMGLLGPKADVLLYQVGNTGGSYAEMFAALDSDFCGPNEIGMQCGGAPHATVVSISYGGNEVQYGPSLAQRLCTEYGKLSLTGMTFVQSTGDFGVAGSANSWCLDDNRNEVIGGNNFNPAIGADCPYVTAVGATEIQPGRTVLDTEQAVTPISSGGGFSNGIERLSFQEAAMQAYIDKYTGDLGPHVFGRFGRGYPDVSANGHFYDTIVSGGHWINGGTSASTPVIAAMLTAINDARIAAGKSVVGWANPVLYSSALAHAFNDITIGNNTGCGPNHDIGFQTAPGWDPVTGLGTPNFQKMLAAWLALQ